MNTMIFLPLYIDPGTGSMLFSLAIGIATAGVFAVRALALKVKFIFSGGKIEKQDLNKIPFVIYSDHKRYWNVFKPICDEAEKKKLSLIFYTSSEDDPALFEKYNFVKTQFIGEGNKAFAKLNMLNAKILLSTTPGLDVYQWKRSRNVDYYVHVPHTVDDLAGYRMFGLDFYDAVLTSGKNQVSLIRKMEELRPNIKQKEIVTVGSVPLDNLKKRFDTIRHSELVSESTKEMLKQVQHDSNDKNSEHGNNINGKLVETTSVKTVLLAPSWGESGMLTRFGDKMLSALSKTDFNIIIRPHPQTVVSEQKILQPLMEKFSNEKYPNLEWNFDNDNFAALNKSDILITDFSGIIFDFACVFDKPLIYTKHAFNTLPYDADWLSEPMWSFRVVDKIGIELKEENLNNISDLINSALNSKNLQNGRNEIRSECWENVSLSAQKIVDYLIKKEKEIDSKSQKITKKQN